MSSHTTILDILLKEKLELLEEPKAKKDRDPAFLTKDEKLFFYKNGIKH